MSKGLITSASLIANGPAFEDAVARIRDFPLNSFGVHLNITEGFPLTSCPDLEVILKENGGFAGDKIRHLVITRKLRKAVFAEWTAQVRRAAERGVPVSHFDGHHHIHTVPGLFGALKQLQRKFGIRKVRITMNIYPRGTAISVSKQLSKGLWNLSLRLFYQTKTTGGFTSLDIFTKSASAPSFPSIELMVHPGSKDCEKETYLLSTEWWKGMPVEIQKISYHEL